MIRPALRLAYRFGLATVFATVVLAGLAAVRLMYGPLSLSPLTPLLEAELNKELKLHSIRVGDTLLRWAPAERRVELTFADVRLLDDDGREVASVPAMDVGLSAAALGRGYIVPERVEVRGPSATLVRRADGGIQLGFARSGAQEVGESSASFFSALVDELSKPATSAGDRLRFLKSFLIRDATLTFFDGLSRTAWQAPNARLALARSPQGLVAHLDARIGLAPGSRGAEGADTFGLRADGVLARGDDVAKISADLSDLNPARLAGTTARESKLAGLDLPLSGRAELEVTTLGRVESGTFWLRSGAGRFELPGFPRLALSVIKAEVQGRFDGASDMITFERVSYDAGGNRGQLGGTATLVRSADRHVERVALDLAARQVAINLPQLFAEPSRIDQATFRGEIAFASGHIGIDRVSFRMGPTQLDLAGAVDDAPGSPAVTLDGTLKTMPAADFAKLWPAGPALGARDWLIANVHKGRIDSGTIAVRLAPGAALADKLPDEAVDLAFDFSGVEATYLKGLTPISDARGRARLQGNRFELWVDDARVGTVAATGRFFDDNIAGHGHPADIEAHIDGDASALLAVLDQEPLGYPRRYGLDPEKVGGRVSGVLTARLPLLRNLSLADLKLGAEIDLEDARLPDLYRGLGVDGGRAHFSVTEKGLTAQGTVTIAGAPAAVRWTEVFSPQGKPSTTLTLSATLDSAGRARAVAPMDTYIQGPSPLTLELTGRGVHVETVKVRANLDKATVHIPELNWTKPAGQAGSVSFLLDASAKDVLALRKIEARATDLAISGDVVLNGEGKLQSATLDPVRVGHRTNARLVATRSTPKSAPRDLVTVSISGPALDASELVREARKSLDAETDESKKSDVDVGAVVTRLGLANDVVMSDVKLRYATRNRKIAVLDASGLLNGKERAVVSLAPNDTGQRIVSMRTKDGGALFAGLALTDKVIGGDLALDMTLPPLSDVVAPPPTGKLDMTGFRVQRAPILAQLLTVASFGGVRDLLNGDGITFETLSVPFRIEEDRFRVSEGRAYGPAIGLTLDGAIPKGSGDYELTGTLVPAYTLNTLLGYVPMLGNLLVSRSGEGVIGLTYAISGESAAPQVYVNPLSAFAPGFLRRLFQIGDASAAQKSAPVVPE